MHNYLMNCMSSLESKHKNSGILLLGDFNKPNVANLKSSYRLKQIVNFPTRGANTLDLVLTNLQDVYDFPDRLPPFGFSRFTSFPSSRNSREERGKPAEKENERGKPAGKILCSKGQPSKGV